jgi:hypothetical protein
MSRWTAYYTGNRVFDSNNLSWAELPDDGVLIVVEYQQGGRRIVDGGDWYWLEDGRINYVPSVSWDNEEPKPNVSCQSCVKRGAKADDDTFYSLYDRVRRGDDL